MKFTIFILIICLQLFYPSAHSSVTCADVEKLDNINELGGSLLYFVGCRTVSAGILSKEWSKFPEAAQILLNRYYLVSESRHMNWNDPKLIQSIGDGSTLIQRMLALEYSLDSPDMIEVWQRVYITDDQISDFELAIYGMMYYFHHEKNDSKKIPEWSPSPARTTMLLESSDVPLFRVVYARMLEFGQWAVGDEEDWITIYDTYDDVLPLAGWMKADYYKGKIDYGIFEYRQYSQEIINLLKSGMERGFIWSAEYLAEIYNLGDITDMDEKTATQIYQKLAHFGLPAMQIEFGKQLVGGYGVEKNDTAGWDWIEKGATSYSIFGVEGYDWLYRKYLNEADYFQAIHWAFQNALIGYVSYEDNGYFAIKSLLANLPLSKKNLVKLNEYLRFHCETNSLVYSISDCQNLAKNSVTFTNRPQFAEVINNTSLLGLTDEIQLKTGRYVALIISNDSYKYWDTLITPQNDANLIGKILESDYEFEVHYIQNASRRDTLRAIYDVSSSLKFDDHFLLYYAGHGIVDSTTDSAYWIPSDASRDFRPDWISSAEIMTSLKVIPSKHLLLVADSCYSGRLLRGAAPTEKSPSSAIVQRLFAKKARVAITSGGDEPVQDIVSGSEHSIFATAFANALKATKKPTPSSQIFNNILGAVSLEANQTPQYADMRELGHDGGDFIFIPTDK